ncbi:ABC transporter ATP-binding protein [Cupriavidus sp. 2TAF22]|uniref:ABC transporter ATP-binding protein n=1 Tax=unclassified Cupriavidus TaxID=2640874 RepID=UPI003F901F7C
MHESMLSVTKLRKRFGGLQVTNGLSLDVWRNEFHALIGPNGAGKTTLINQLHGTFFPDAGDIQLDGVDITRLPVHARATLGLARSFQISSVIPDFTALQNVALAVQAGTGHSFRFWRPTRDDATLLAPAREALHLAGLEARADTAAVNLSHGERRQLEIAIALAMRPKVMLLDEPMAGMGQNESRQLVDLLQRLKGEYTIVMVEHDMDAVFALADRLSVLVAGSVIATGTPDDIRRDASVQAAYLGHSEPRS